MPGDIPTALQVPASWVGIDEMPIQLVNAFVGITMPGEVFVNLGSFSPPPITGATDEERLAQIQAVSFVAVKPVARIALTEQRLDELIATLEATRKSYRAMMKNVQIQDNKNA